MAKGANSPPVASVARACDRNVAAIAASLDRAACDRPIEGVVPISGSPSPVFCARHSDWQGFWLRYDHGPVEATTEPPDASTAAPTKSTHFRTRRPRLMHDVTLDRPLQGSNITCGGNSAHVAISAHRWSQIGPRLLPWGLASRRLPHAYGPSGTHFWARQSAPQQP